ncbi:HepT-like ribonuclease domain-containing protein [Rhodopila globiformis]|uniref:HepT-like ribonuclease domain-containing protein n=1 Tax=Rhodopila globiformis TaxID=1071 RepID=UPI00195D00B0|nr:HepT-like ribonuclease domain-containing protein [Rhodopila globiformis]
MRSGTPSLARRIPDRRDIIAFRNLLIHGYAMVDHDRVWQIVSQSLPELRTAVDALLAELGPPEA